MPLKDHVYLQDLEDRNDALAKLREDMYVSNKKMKKMAPYYSAVLKNKKAFYDQMEQVILENLKEGRVFNFETGLFEQMKPDGTDTEHDGGGDTGNVSESNEGGISPDVAELQQGTK